jgi:type VI secretion system protein ImpL
MPTWLPWVIIGVALAFGIGLVVYNYVTEGEEENEADLYDENSTTLPPDGRKSADPLVDTLATTSEEYRTARKSRMIALKESLEKSLEVRQGPSSASSKDRMSMPWFMLVGADGSGKTTLLKNTGLELPYGPAFEVDSIKKDAGRWWLYEDAVVLEAPAAAPGATATGTTLGPDQTQAVNTSEGWKTLLHMLRRERPDSPLNGIIVTISAADLIAGQRDPDKLLEHAERIRIFLERTRAVLGVRLPLHVLVTKCDALPGFRSFALNLPESRRHDVFGWSNPGKVDAPYNPDWIHLGMASLRTSLDDLRDELLAAPDEIQDPDGLFVFISEFAELQEPLKEFVTKLIGDDHRRPPLFLRGMYFSGDALGGRIELLDENAPFSLADLGADESEGKKHHLVFLRSLFSEKIFQEAGLARPMARLRLSRDRRVLLAQAAAILFAVVGFGGLWMSVNGYERGETRQPGLRQRADEISRVLAGIAIDLDDMKRGGASPDSSSDRRMRDAVVIELVSDMRGVDAIRKSAFIPASWLSPLPNDIKQSMIAGIESIVLPVSRQRLLERVAKLIGDEVEVTEMRSDPRALVAYLNDVKALSRNIARYNAIAMEDSGTVTDLAALLDYLYQERPLQGASLTSNDFQAAIRDAKAPLIATTPSMAQSVLRRSVAMVTSVARGSARQLTPRATPQLARAVRPEDDLAALRGLEALVTLSSPDSGLVALVTDAPIFGLRIARLVQDSVTNQLRMTATMIGRDSLSSEESLQRLRTVVDRLFQLRFMERSEERTVLGEIPPNGRLRWDVGRLELALALRGEFDNAVLTVSEILPGQSPDRLRRAFQVQLRSRAIDIAASAQRFVPSGALDPAAEMRTSVANLEQAAGRIVRVAQLLDTLRAGDDGRRLVASAARQAEQALLTAQRMIENGRYFEPRADSVAGWKGFRAIGFTAMAVSDSLRAGTALMQHTSAVWTLSRDVAPALRFLRLAAVDTVHSRRLLTGWENITVAVQRYERGDVTSTLGVLLKFIRDDMSVSDVADCRARVPGADTAGAGADFFVWRRVQFRAAMAARCGSAGSEAANAYGRLRASFTNGLAGRFPFVDSTRSVASRDAEPAVLRSFLRQYDAFIAAGQDVALRADPRQAGPARAAMAFLDQVAQVRAFLAPMMDSPRALPRYTLLFGEGEFAHDEPWLYGGPIRVEAVDVEDAAHETGLTVSGAWAPLRFAVRENASYERIRFFDPETGEELKVPAFPVSAPEIFRTGPR